MEIEKRNEIFKRLLDDKGLTQSDLMRKSSLSRSTISDLINGRRRITGDMIEKIADAIGNDTYLYFYGVSVPQTKNNVVMQGKKEHFVPFYDKNFACGTSGGFDSVLENKNPDSLINFPGLPETAATFIVRAYGRSMINRKNPTHSIPEGALVVLRKNVSGNFQWGEVYALATADGCIIKKIMPSTESNCVRCYSYNTEEGYEAFDINHTDIFDSAVVVGVLNYNRW